MAISADDKFIIFLSNFPKNKTKKQNRIWHFMQIDSSGDTLHEMLKPVFLEK